MPNGFLAVKVVAASTKIMGRHLVIICQPVQDLFWNILILRRWSEVELRPVTSREYGNLINLQTTKRSI